MKIRYGKALHVKPNFKRDNHLYFLRPRSPALINVIKPLNLNLTEN